VITAELILAQFNQGLVKIKLRPMKDTPSEKLPRHGKHGAIPRRAGKRLSKVTAYLVVPGALRTKLRLLAKLLAPRKLPSQAEVVIAAGPYRLRFPWCPTLQRHVNYDALADVFAVYEARHFTRYKAPPILGHNRHGKAFWVDHEAGELLLRAVWKDQYDELLPWLREFVRNGPRVNREGNGGWVYAFARTSDVRLVQQEALPCVLLHKVGYTRRSPE